MECLGLQEVEEGRGAAVRGSARRVEATHGAFMPLTNSALGGTRQDLARPVAVWHGAFIAGTKDFARSRTGLACRGWVGRGMARQRKAGLFMEHILLSAQNISVRDCWRGEAGYGWSAQGTSRRGRATLIISWCF